jgi:mono/diheme cytochrome c family protein
VRKRLPTTTVEALIVLGVLTIAFTGAIIGITVWLVNQDDTADVGAAIEPAAEETPPATTEEPTGTEPSGTTAETETEETGENETDEGETEETETEEPDETQPPAGGGDAEAGAEVFASAGCASCHTLAAAGSTGTIGPNLDDSQPPLELVVDRVTNGQGAMPAFAGQLSPDQINDVAAYVVQSTSG